MSLTDFQLA